jgi:hypothetical protein
MPAIGNANFGWFSGGTGAAEVSTVDRVDFSNDSPTSASPRGPMSRSRNGLSGISNSNYGWNIGGLTVVPGLAFLSTVDRIDFANDGSTAIVRASLSQSSTSGTATGNANFGWVFLGVAGFSAFRSTVHRIDFSNDIATASVRGPLESPLRSNMGAMSTANFGWIAGGGTTTPVALSTVSRIDFANDSPTSAITRGPLSQGRGGISASSSANFGWVVVGYNQTPTGQIPLSTIDRIDFATDTVTASSRSPLSTNRSSVAATSNYTK